MGFLWGSACAAGRNGKLELACNYVTARRKTASLNRSRFGLRWVVWVDSKCPQAPQDGAGRETPEREGLRKSQVGSSLSVSVSSALRFAQVLRFRVRWVTAHGVRWAAGVGRPGIEPPSAAVSELLSGATHRWAGAS
eukprot:scaffold33547_cov129-Isochrysis_galbana.AAC.5